MPGAPQKILVIRLSSIGDILLATPLLRILRRNFPEARIDFVIKSRFAELLRHNPHLNELLVLDTETGQEGLQDLRRRINMNRYDLVIDIHKNFRSYYLRFALPGTRVVTHSKQLLRRFLLVHFGINLYGRVVPIYQRYIRAMAPWGLSDDGLGLEFHIDPQAERLMALRLAERPGARLLVGLAPGAGFATKRWPADFYQEIARRLKKEHNADILLLGNKADREVTGAIAAESAIGVYDWAGTLTLQQSAAALAHCHLLICNDTGLMHLACALKIPVLALFGPTTREFGFFPVGRRAEVIERVGLSCRPCSHLGGPHCPKDHFRCMREILPEEVMVRAGRILQNESPS
ncbi:MAG TPA: lipopolysaccharide heptosyltransferase II [bacterium]|nr:lipopolysaccharide heptosyltransferase II [bacterium]HQG44552.1 lipopolysaccharide heptosyltransferase II [bacterium]HQI48194.1 lipopolysaccharide heptosyltransferase II [bacterium]HQJ64545.1 lipopolysaccharide heptosyltransferase II [bacterium]